MKSKTILTFISLVLVFILQSCGIGISRFVKNAPRLGMTKQAFIDAYGVPLRQNIFYDENSSYCEELIYRELINNSGEERAINSIFLFRDGKLDSQFQEDDREYQHKLERLREQQLIKDRIETEKERIAVEKERIEKERKEKKE